MIKTKKELLDASLTIKTTFTLALTLMPMIDRKEYDEVLQDLSSTNTNVAALQKNLTTHKKQLITWYFNTQLLNSIREYVETVKDYCCQNNGSINYNIFYSDNTITFARYIRNCISHGLTFSFRKQDIKRVQTNPPRWRGKIIDCTLNGKPFSTSFMNHQDVIDLLNDLEAIITDKIT
jgi:hypothetical protein